MKIHTLLVSTTAVIATLAASTLAFAQTTRSSSFDTVPPLPVQPRSTVTTVEGPDSQRTVTTIQAPPSETVIVSKTTIYGQQLARLLKDNPKTKRFYNLLVTSGLSAPLEDDGFTAFVPVDESFAGTSVGANYTAGVVDPASRRFLEQHIVKGKFPAELLNGDKDRLTTLAGNQIILSRGNFNTFYANGIRIRETEKTPLGIIYYLDKSLVQ